MAEDILARNIAWIASADSKAAAVFGFDAAMLGVLAALTPSAERWTVPTALAAGFSALTLIASLACLGMSTFPRLTGPKGSIIFFGTACALRPKEFSDRVKKGITDELVDDVAEQAYRNAEIATGKFQCLKYAQILLFVSVIPWLLAVYLLYLHRR